MHLFCYRFFHRLFHGCIKTEKGQRVGGKGEMGESSARAYRGGGGGRVRPWEACGS